MLVDFAISPLELQKLFSGHLKQFFQIVTFGYFVNVHEGVIGGARVRSDHLLHLVAVREKGFLLVIVEVVDTPI